MMGKTNDPERDATETKSEEARTRPDQRSAKDPLTNSPGTPPASSRKHYSFEDAGYRNPRAMEAEALRDAFLSHINLPTEVYQGLDAQTKVAVDDFVTHVLLNIEWYTRKAKRQHYAKIAADAFVVAVVLVTGGLSIYAAFHGSASGAGPLDAGGALVASLTTSLAMLKFISEAHDFQKYRSNYWQAAADLKTRLYSFEEECRRVGGEVSLFAQGRPTPAFVARLRAEVEAALEICRKQQAAFYDLLAEPSVLIEKAATTRAAFDDAFRVQRSRWAQQQVSAAKLERLKVEPEIRHLEAKQPLTS